MSKRVLFIVPHADDEVLGFGGTIAKRVDKGDEVIVTISQAPNNDRAAQQLQDSKEAKSVLGYSKQYFLHLSDKTMCNDLYELIEAVQRHIIEIKPDIIYTTHYSDNHQDHKSLYRALAIVSRPNGFIGTPTIIAGEVISSHDQSFGSDRSSFTPNRYEILTETHLKRKLDAIKRFSLEIQQWPHSRSLESIKAKAIVRGSECRSKYAEAFMTLREVNK